MSPTFQDGESIIGAVFAELTSTQVQKHERKRNWMKRFQVGAFGPLILIIIISLMAEPPTETTIVAVLWVLES